MNLEDLIGKERANRLQSQGSRLKQGFKDSFGEGREDSIKALHLARELEGKDANAVRASSLLGTTPLFTRTRDLVGMSNPTHREVRRSMGMGLSDDRAVKTGQIMGTIANDLVNDSTRSIWWLLNAPQATANVLNELALKSGNNKLYSASKVRDNSRYKEGMPVLKTDQKTGEVLKDNRQFDDAVRAGVVDYNTGRTKKGISVKGGKYYRRDYEPTDVAALGILPGAAINFGLGLMTPFGGAEGYEAAVPSAADPSKTDNVVAEVALKYFLGRTGNLLPYEEFKKVRPDVSKGEYNAYKAFKWDKGTDLDLRDGDFTLPAGILKGTTEGIHGPEIQFLGRSMPLTTALIPYASSVAGTVAGVRTKRPIRRGLQGGLAGFVGGQALGQGLEALRRSRNIETSAPVTQALDPESTTMGL